MKTYKLSYQDKLGNELMSKQITACNIKQARLYRDMFFYECLLNDCVKIKVSLSR